MRFDRTQPFISITAILAFLGVGIMVLIVAVAIMEGMIRHFEERLFVMNYLLTIFATQRNALDSALLADLESKFPHLKFSSYLHSQGAAKLGSNLNAGLISGVSLSVKAAFFKIISSEKIYNHKTRKFYLNVDDKQKQIVAMNPHNQANFKLTLNLKDLEPLEDFSRRLK